MSSRKKAPPSKKRSAEPQAGFPGFGFPTITLLLAAGQLLVLGARAAEGGELTANALLPFALWLASSAVGVAALRLLKFRGSTALVSGVLLLSGIGVLVRSRMSGVAAGVTDMGLWIQPVGFVLLLAAWAASRGGAENWRVFWGLSLLAALALAGGMLVVGTRYRGGLYAPGGMTPTELLKLFVPLALAGFFSGAKKPWAGRLPWNPPLRQTLALAVFWAALCALLVLQRDLGLVLLLSLTLLGMLMCATGRASWGMVALVTAVVGGMGVMRTFAHGARRIEAWLDPFADPTGSGWQILQGLSGLYAGGLLGTGIGSGRPDRLPIASSDFVYAVYGEELGYIGSLLLLGLFAHLLRAGARVTRLQGEGFSHLLAAGLTTSLAVQILVNIGGVVNLLPVTGITLPYISQGGSSYWVVSVQFGLLLGLSEVIPSPGPTSGSRQGPRGGRGQKGSATPRGKRKAPD